jgi:hypothetical protein
MKIVGMLLLAMVLSFTTGSVLAIENTEKSNGIAVTGITVVSPNGGEIWPEGTNKEIKWSSTGNTGPNVRIELWKGLSLYKVITSSTPNDGSYIWSIPYSIPIGTNYKIRIKSTTLPYADTSNNYYTIGGIYVKSPNGGEIWPEGTNKEIKWSYAGNPGPNVKIELWKDGFLYRVITSSTPNDGSYIWSIPYSVAIGNNYKVRIYSTTNPAYRDVSNNYYTIGGIYVKSPNGGEIWSRGTSHTISWTYYGNPGPNVKIELWKGSSLYKVITSSTPNDGSYNWLIPSSYQTGTNYKVRIYSTTNPAYRDVSNNYYTIN